MANRRMISSDIWEDDWFGQLDFFEQTLWIGLFSKCADDQGRLLNNPVLLRAAIFPYKDVPPTTIAKAIAGFAEAGRVILYATDGKNVLQLVNWWEHQRPQWAQPSKWAPPDDWHDRIRTRDGGVYRAENWFESKETSKAPPAPTSNDPAMRHTLSHKVQDNLVGQYPVPVPDPVSVSVQVEEVGASAPAATPPPAEPAKRIDARSDPRTKTAAIQCAKAAIGGRKYPPLEMYDAIIGALGDRPDGKRLIECRRAWIERGYNANAWTWLTEWYGQGIPSRGNGHASRASPPHDNDAWANMDAAAIIESNRIRGRDEQ